MGFEKLYGRNRQCLQLLTELHLKSKKPIEIAEALNPLLIDDTGYAGAISELVRDAYIYADWDDDALFDKGIMRYNHIVVTDKAHEYFEWEKDNFAQNNTIYNIGSVVASNSNLVIGNTVDTIQSIHGIHNNIKKQIDTFVESQDKEDIHSLFEEAIEITNKMLDKGYIIQNLDFVMKLNQYRDQYQWFFTEITQIFGIATLSIMKGSNDV